MTNQNRFEDLISEELTVEDQATIAGGASFTFNDSLLEVENNSGSVGEAEIEISSTETYNYYY